MVTLILSKRVNASIEEVWASWNDFGNIYKYNPNLRASNLLGNPNAEPRVGSKRQCDFANGKDYVRKEIIAYKNGEMMKVDVYDGTLPLKSMVAIIKLERISDDRTRVRFTVHFEAKFGILGKLMAPSLKRQFRPMLQALLDANADYVELGKEVAIAA